MKQCYLYKEPRDVVEWNGAMELDCIFKRSLKFSAAGISFRPRNLVPWCARVQQRAFYTTTEKLTSLLLCLKDVMLHLYASKLPSRSIA